MQFAATDGAKHSAGCLELLLKYGAKTGECLAPARCNVFSRVAHVLATCDLTRDCVGNKTLTDSFNCADAVDNEFDMTAWLWACDHGRSACLQPLIDAGPSALHIAGWPYSFRLLIAGPSSSMLPASVTYVAPRDGSRLSFALNQGSWHGVS